MASGSLRLGGFGLRRSCCTPLDMVAGCRQARPMFLSIEVIGMWYERGWRWAREHLTITVPGVVLIFAATYIMMLAVNAGEVGAAWVQAIGSVAAILAAWMIPHLHERARLRKVQNDIYDSAGWLALRIRNELTAMQNVLDRAVEEADPAESVVIWRTVGGVAECSIHKQAADELPISAFCGVDISYLMAIRAAAGFGVECSEVLSGWDFEAVPDITNHFPLYGRLAFHLNRIEWAMEHTHSRPGSGVGNRGAV